MNPLLYIIRRTLINSIKELKRKPGVLILYLFLIVMCGLFLVLSFIPKEPTLMEADPAVYGMIVSGVILFMVYSSVSKSIKSGTSFFRMADVNLAFPAPISPKKMLLYGFLKQIWVSLLGVFVLIWQIPNLRNYYEIKGSGVFVLFFSFVVLLFFLQLLGLLIYSWTSRSTSVRSRASKGWNFLLGLFGLAILVKLMELKDLSAALRAVLHSKAFETIPVIGWFKTISMEPLLGPSPRFYLAVALLVAATVLLMVVFFYQKSDYYEDVLANTEQKEALFAAKRSGKAIRNGNESLIKRRQIKGLTFRSGAAAIFSRQMLEYRKRGFFLIDRSTVVLAVFGFAAQYYLPNNDLTLLLMFSLYYLFLMSFQGSWARELEKPYVYLMPAHSGAKLFYATLADLVKAGLDGVVLFGFAAGFLHANPALAVLCAVGFVTYSAAFTYSDVLFRRLFGPLHGKVAMFFLRIFLLLILIVPGVVIGLVARYATGLEGLAADFTFVGSMIAWNLLLVGGIFALAKGIFDRLEMK